MVRYDKIIEENGGFSMASWITASAPSASRVTHGSPACLRAYRGMKIETWPEKCTKSVPKVCFLPIFWRLKHA